MSLKIIVAMSNNWVIGSEGGIPWDCKEDRDYFKRVTEGHDLIVGRKTYETCRNLPRLIVLSQRLKVKDLQRKDTQIARNVAEVLQTCTPDTYVIGGAQIYHVFLPMAQWLMLSQVNVSCSGDTFFPDFGHRQWELVNEWWKPGCHFNVFQKVHNAVL